VLVVEDNQADTFLLEEAVREHKVPAHLTIVGDGQEAIEHIESVDREVVTPPKLVLLDLNLPRRSGLEVLGRLRQSAKCRDVPVIIITSSDTRLDRERTAQLGAVHYFRKPSDYQQFLQIGVLLNDLLREPG
jgi:CheY-like chemotaxis protein